MTLYDDEADSGYGQFQMLTTGRMIDAYDYLTRAADAATRELLTSAYEDVEDSKPEDLSAGFAPVSHRDLDGNDSYEQLEGLLQDERVAAIIEHYGISPESFGYDFTLTRNREGVGFWDRGYGEFTDERGNHTDVSEAANGYQNDGDYLTEMAHSSGGAIVFFDRDDDGNITHLRFVG